jgi:hypothetical protein
VAVTYVRRRGLSEPFAAFERLRPFREALIGLQNQCRPFGSDYLVLEAVKKALETAAHHFTAEPDFFPHKPEQTKAGAHPT